jgi:hypothetical protein
LRLRKSLWFFNELFSRKFLTKRLVGWKGQIGGLTGYVETLKKSVGNFPDCIDFT